MSKWQLKLRVRTAGWYWVCQDHCGTFICASPVSFKTRWQAVQNFERWFEDFWAVLNVRLPQCANADADWVCGR